MNSLIKNIFITFVFLFPFLHFSGFALPTSVTREFIMLLVSELFLLLYLWGSVRRGKLQLKKSHVPVAIAVYIGILFLTALVGVDFGKSFWSSYLRMTGILMWLHYFALFFVVASLFSRAVEWRNVFRAVALSGFSLAVATWFDAAAFLGNTSYSGAYLLLAFFLSFIGLALENKRAWKWVYGLALATIFFSPNLFSFESLVGIARASTLVLWFGLLLFLALFVVNKIKNKKVVAGICVSLIVLILGSYAYGFISIISKEGRLYETFVEESGPQRDILWDISIDSIKERPVFGYGHENFSHVFDRNLNAELLTLNEPWFDRAHNFTLEQFISAGLVGALAMLAIFVLTTYKSISLFLREHKLYFLLIPFILLFHFLQLQTAFEAGGSLLLIFITLAFLVSHEKPAEIKIPAVGRKYYKFAVIILFAVSFYFFVYSPVKENLLISQVSSGRTFDERKELVPKLHNLKVNPTKTVNLVSEGFTTAVWEARDEIKEQGLDDEVKEEYLLYMDLYENYLPKYGDDYRFLIRYAKLVNVAYAWGADELERVGPLMDRALEISENYPHPYWQLSVNAYYRGEDDDAVRYAGLAQETNPELELSKEFYALMTRLTKFSNLQRELIPPIDY